MWCVCGAAALNTGGGGVIESEGGVGGCSFNARGTLENFSNVS